MTHTPRPSAVTSRAAEDDGTRPATPANAEPAGGAANDRAHAWLRTSMAALAVLAAAAAAVSWDAQ